MNENKLILAHEMYIKNQPDGAVVILEVISVALLSEIVQRALKLASPKVYIKTKNLKHMYEKRPESVYEFLLRNLDKIIHFPDRVYRNPAAKRGEFCFVKQFKNELFLAAIEFNAHPETGEEINLIVTAFKIKHRYVSKYELIWDWKDGDTSS